MKKVFALLLMVTIVAMSSVFSQSVKYAKITMKDGTVLPVKMNAIENIEVVDSTYSTLVDSIYRNLKGSWYTTSYKVAWTKNGPWETPSFTPNKSNYDSYFEDNTTLTASNGLITYRGYYYIDIKGNCVQIGSDGDVLVMEIKKLNKTDMELLFYYNKSFFVYSYFKKL